MIAIAEEEFTRAIGECARAWKERWKRPPTVNELASAFDVCLSANADDYVDDAATVLTKNERTTTTTTDESGDDALPEVDPDAYNMAIRDPSSKSFNLDACDVWQRGAGAPKDGGLGEVRGIIELDGDRLIVDVSIVHTHGLIKTFARACTLLHAFAVPRYLSKKKLHAKTVTYRAMAGLEMPESMAIAVD